MRTFLARMLVVSIAALCASACSSSSSVPPLVGSWSGTLNGSTLVFDFAGNQSGTQTTTTPQCATQELIVFGWSSTATQLTVSNSTCIGTACTSASDCGDFAAGSFTYGYTLSNNDETLVLTDPSSSTSMASFTRLQ